MTSIATPPPPEPAATLWIEGSVETLLDVLMREHGFEERSMMLSDGMSVPEGVFVQRERGGLLVWVPPDPSRTAVDPVVLPPAVRIEAQRAGGGTRLKLHRVMAPATVVAVVSTLGLSLAAVAGAWVIGGAIAWAAAATLGCVVWVVLIHQRQVAAGRAHRAWDMLQPALRELEAPEPAGDPYR